nr:MAG TPA: pentapeptide repeat protein [Caudoviricetes sp.]
MKIHTAKGILEGESIEAIIEKYGRDCLSGANLSYADLSDANLRSADLSDANLRDAKLSKFTVAQTSILPDEGDIIGWKKHT